MKSIDISTSIFPNTFALVDDEDYESINRYQWRVLAPKISRTMYAVRFVGKKAILMHRTILDAKKGESVDHRNDNGLDNQRHNLRQCSHKQNIQNRRRNRNNKCGYKGVYWEKRYKKWEAYIGSSSQGNRKILGHFFCLIEAAEAYDEAAVARYGEFARLNFPMQTSRIA